MKSTGRREIHVVRVVVETQKAYEMLTMTKLRVIKQRAFWNTPQSEKIMTDGVQLVCPACGGNDFCRQTADVNFKAYLCLVCGAVVVIE